MPILFFGGVALILFAFSRTAQGLSMGGPLSRAYGLRDVSPQDQKGGFKTTYDPVFLKWADNTGVPFALLKAHAIIESSLNPNAFNSDESGGRSDRAGWASRGLMQLLWWPGSDRWAQFGYSASKIGSNPDMLFTPDINVELGAKLIAANLKSSGGNLRDAINMYNAGVKESVRKAPNDYVGKVLSKYQTIVGGAVV